MLKTSHLHIAFHIGLESCILRIDLNSGLFFFFTWYIPLIWVFLYLPPVFATIVLIFTLLNEDHFFFQASKDQPNTITWGLCQGIKSSVIGLFFLFQFYFLSPSIQHNPVHALLLCQIILPSPAVPSTHSPLLPLAGISPVGLHCTLILAIL